jgi:hypothetical protein
LELDDLDDVLSTQPSQHAPPHNRAHAAAAASSTTPQFAATAPTGQSLFRAPLRVDSHPLSGGGIIGARASSSSKPSSSSYEDPSESSVDEFDQHIEQLLARSAGPPVVSKMSLGASGPRGGAAANKYASRSGGGMLDSDGLDSARSTGSVVSISSITSANSYQPSRDLNSTWSAQHARPSVGLAAARAQRREMQAQKH